MFVIRSRRARQRVAKVRDRFTLTLGAEGFTLKGSESTRKQPLEVIERFEGERRLVLVSKDGRRAPLPLALGSAADNVALADRLNGALVNVRGVSGLANPPKRGCNMRRMSRDATSRITHELEQRARSTVQPSMPRSVRPILASVVAISLVGFALAAQAETTAGGTPTASGQCAPPQRLPAVRSAKQATGHDGLSVHSPPWKAPLSPGLRLRTHAQRDGGWSVWNGPEVPSFVPIESGKRWLDLLDQNGTTYVALYRERPADWTTLKNRNLSSEVRLFDCSGKELTSVLLDPYLSRPDHLEVQDIRYDGTTLYFNEACQTFSREAGGRCSALVALDPIAKKVLWRTNSLVSNNWFALTGDYVVAAYGFTAEPAAIRVIRKKDGVVLDTQKLQGTNFELFQQGDSIAVEHWHSIGRTLYKMQGFDGPTPKLVRTSSINPSPADPAGKPSPPRSPPDPSRPVPTER